MGEAQLALEQKQEKELLLQQRQSRVQNTVKQYGLAVINDITHSQTEPNLDRKIRLICYGIIVIILYNSYRTYYTLKLIAGSPRFIDANQILLILLYLSLILGVNEFWHRKKTGWILLTAFATFTALDSILAFVAQLRYNMSSCYLIHLSSKRLVTDLFLVVVYIGMMDYLNRSDLRTVFNISKKTSNQTIIFTSLFAFIYMKVLTNL